MYQAILFGFIGGISLVIGAFIGLYFKLRKRTIGAIMAFGSGVLICALTFSLMEEAYTLGGFDSASAGFLIGGLLFAFGDYLIDKAGGHYRKRVHGERKPHIEKISGSALALGAVLDGVPESLAIGIGVLSGKGLGFLMVLAVFLSNLPESISGAIGMKNVGRSKKYIITLWSSICIISAISAFVGYVFFDKASPDLLAFTQALAAGAILAMIADTMIPEAFEESGRLVTIVTVLGFLTAFIISKLAV